MRVGKKYSVNEQPWYPFIHVDHEEACGWCTASPRYIRRTSGATRARPACGRTELEGRACNQAKGWGECPADRRSAAPVVPPSPHAPRARPPVLAGGPTDALTIWLIR